jgi:hypothetical protein
VDRVIRQQQEICKAHGVAWVEAPPNLKVGLARNVRSSLRPLNGLRHPPEGDTTGWYIWAGGELSTDPDFFEPFHVVHLAEVCPQVLGLLGLPPGWRFLVDGDHLDVWSDPALLDI